MDLAGTRCLRSLRRPLLSARRDAAFYEMLAEKLEDKIGLAASTYTGYDLYHAAVHANLEVVEVFVAFYLHKLLPLIYCLIMTQAAKTGSPISRCFRLPKLSMTGCLEIEMPPARSNVSGIGQKHQKCGCKDPN